MNQTFRNQCLLLVEAKLKELLQAPPLAPHAQLFSAAQYALTSGKRLRPLLTLAIAHLYSTPLEKALIPACTLELIHTYSLIHDDLPCMDDDDFRRGRPSLHKSFPEGLAVLTGDFLLTYAFELLSKSPDLEPIQKLKLIQTLSQNAGSEGMIGGQVVDLACEGSKISAELLFYMHSKKTAALFTTSLLFGGIIAHVSPNELEQLATLGEHLGIAFQLADDLEDEGEKHKSTALTVLGREKTEHLIHELKEKAHAILDSLNCKSDFVNTLIPAFSKN